MIRFLLSGVFRRGLLLAMLWLSATALLSCGRSALEAPTTSRSGDTASATPMRAANLPEAPSDLDFERRPLFHERLVPLCGSTTPAENRALADAIRSGLAHRELLHTDELEAFLREHPRSPWRASLLTNLGILWRGAARYGDALRAWEEAWMLTKADTSWRGRATADRAVSELAYLSAQLGRQRRLSELFAELAVRPPLGAAAERTGLARLGLASMLVHPERSFRCGPLAVGSVWQVLHPHDGLPAAVDQTPSTTEGTSFTQLLALGERVGAPLRALRRRPGTGFVVPSVIHWREEHFAAIVGIETSRGGERVYVIQDPTFGPEVRTTDRWLEQETSGNVLIPASAEVPSGWEPLDADAASRVWGRGETGGFDPDAFGDRDLVAQCEGSRGMARHGFHAHTAALHVEDTPIWLNNAFGPQVELKVAYNQADREQAQMPWTTSTGARWTHNWESYLELSGNGATRVWRRRMGGGGVATHREENGVARERHAGLLMQHRTLAIPLSAPTPELITSTVEDGSVETFRLSTDGFVLRWYLESRRDAQGNAATVTYDADRRITQITGADGKALTLTYRSNSPSDSDFYLIDHVDDPHGRSANFAYTAHPSAPWFRLQTITDVGGIASSFKYDEVARGFQDASSPFQTVPDPDFLSELTTPYGGIKFRTGWGQPSPLHSHHALYLQRWVQADLPGGEGERIEFREIRARADDCGGLNPCGFALDESLPRGLANALGTSQPTVVNTDFRNTYYWNTTGFARGRSGTNANPSFDPRHAHIFHWIHAGASIAGVAPILESERPPGEHRIHYLYAGQTQLSFLPALILPGYEARRLLRSRVLRDGVPADNASEDWRFHYNMHGRVVETIDPAGRTRCYHYDSTYPQDLISVHAAPCASVSGPEQSVNRLLRLQYHPGGRHLPSAYTGPDGQVTQWIYNARGQPLRELRPDGKAIDYACTNDSSVDPPGAMLEGHPGVSEGRLKLLRLHAPNGDGGAGTARDVRFTYHNNGTVETIVDAEGVTRTFAYDNLERVTSISAPGTAAQPRVTTFDYALRDEAGLAIGGTGFEPTNIVLPGGRTVTRAYDALHRLIRSANGAADVVRYRYHRLRTQGAATHFDLVQKLRDDGHENVHVAWSVPVTSPATVSGTISGHSTSFQQSAQRRSRLGTPQVEESVWDRDLLGRVRQVTEGSDLVTVERRVDGLPLRVCEGGTCTASTPDRQDLTYQSEVHFQRPQGVTLVRAGVSEHTRSTTYYPLGVLGALQPQFRTDTWGGTGAAVAYAYDQIGRLTRAETPSDDLRFEFDAVDRPFRVRGGPGGDLEIARANYSEINGAARPNEIVETLHGCSRSIAYHDATLDFRASELTERNSAGTALSTQRRWFDSTGRFSAEDGQLGSGPWSWRGYYYDAAGRLQWTYDSTGAGNLWRYFESTSHGTSWHFGIHDGYVWIERAWTYVDVHDRPTYRIGHSPGPPESWTGGAVSTDARGRVTADGEYTYHWDSRDRLIRVDRASPAGSWEFEYDGDGRLRRFQEGGAWRRLVWVDGVLYQEFSGSQRGAQPTPVRSFHVDGVTEGSTRYLYERDARGSILRFLQGGEVRRAWGYDPQGNRYDLTSNVTLRSRLGFAGYVTHDDKGLMFTPHRVYSARLRQWLSRDPMGERDSVDGNNLYAYAANDPVNYTDPSGLFIQDIHEAVAEYADYATDSLQNMETGCTRPMPSLLRSLAKGMMYAVPAAVVGMALRTARSGRPDLIFRAPQRGPFRGPPNPHAATTPGEHLYGAHHLPGSPFESWTSDRAIAEYYAQGRGTSVEVLDLRSVDPSRIAADLRTAAGRASAAARETNPRLGDLIRASSLDSEVILHRR